MKSNLTRKYLFIILLATLLYSCDFFNREKTEEPDDEPPYHAKVVWRSNVKTVKYRSGTQEGKYLYLYEDASFDYDNGNFDFRLKKIDAETGETLWITDDFPTIQICAPVIVGDMIYVALRLLIYCFDKNTGGITGIIQTDVDNEELKILGNLVSHKNFLYFGFGNLDADHLARINTDNIIYAAGDDAGTIQMLKPEIMWTSEQNCRVLAKPVFKNDVVFFMTFTGYTDKILEFAAQDTVTKKILWSKFIDYDDGGGYLFINGDIIYMMGKIVSAYHVSNGERLSFSNKHPPPGHDSKGAVYYDSKLYYTNGFPNRGGEIPTFNIVCIDANNGNLVWGDSPKGSGSYGVVPIIHNGKLYFSCANGLRVYDAKTGKLLGADKKSFALSGSSGTMFLYGNLLIFPDAMVTKHYYSYIAVDISEWEGR